MATRSTRREPNVVLTAVLREQGLTQEELASLINQEIARVFGEPGNCSSPQVRRWTSGAVKWPHPKYLLALERILSCSALELGFTPRGRDSVDHLTRTRDAIAAGHDSSEREPVQRRDFLGAVAGTAVAGAAPQPPRKRVGIPEVGALRARLTDLHALDGRFGGADLVKEATHGYHTVSNIIRSCTYSERTSRHLYSVAGEFASSAGWFSFDSGDKVTAENHYNLALKLALMADDHVLQAHVLIAMALQALHRGDAGECAAISRAALEQKAARQNPIIAALFHARLGVSLAHLGEGRQSGPSFLRAERAMNGYDGAVPTPDWLAFFGPGELSGLIALGALALEDHATATTAAEETLSAIPLKYARNRFMHTLTLARAQLGCEDIEKACATTAAAREVVPHVRSERARQALLRIRRKIAEQPSRTAREFIAAWDESEVNAR